MIGLMLGSMNLDMGAETNPVAVTSPNLTSNENNFHTYAAFKYFFLKNKNAFLEWGAGPLAPRTRGARAPILKKHFRFSEKTI